MLWSLATKAGAMAWRGGAQSRPGKVACVMHFGRACWWGWAREGRSVHATAYCPRHVDPFPSACLSCLSFNLCCADKGPRQMFSKVQVFTHKHIHTRQQGRDAGCGGRSSRQPTRGRARAVEGGPESSRRVDYQAVGVVVAVAVLPLSLSIISTRREMARIEDGIELRASRATEVGSCAHRGQGGDGDRSGESRSRARRGRAKVVGGTFEGGGGAVQA